MIVVRTIVEHDTWIDGPCQVKYILYDDGEWWTVFNGIHAKMEPPTGIPDGVTDVRIPIRVRLKDFRGIQ